MAITFRQLRVFETVAQVLSYTAAAHHLHLSQPAVFNQIKKLEEKLGLPLFETIGKNIYLTDAGRELFERSHLISTELYELTHAFNELKGIERGSLRFAASSTTMPFISQMLSGFFDDHPAISLKIDIATRETQLKHLENNDVEFVIMGRPPEQIYDVQVFMENPLVIVAPIIRYWHLVTRKGKKISPSARAFMDYVIQKSQGDWPLKNLYQLAGIAYARG